MKIYTEEQVKNRLNVMFLECTTKAILNSLTPIELPSDEEIKKHADYEQNFIDGAKWMKEEILGKEDKTFKQKSKWTEVDNATRRLK